MITADSMTLDVNNTLLYGPYKYFPPARRRSYPISAAKPMRVLEQMTHCYTELHEDSITPCIIINHCIS